MTSPIWTNANMAGRTLGKTTIICKIANKKEWQCICHHCEQEYVCGTQRIEQGYAAKHGCGCKQLRRGVTPMGPSPRLIIPYQRAR